MALFVYVTEECKADAEKHDHKEEIKKLAKRIKKEQRLTLFDNFPPPYLKKRFKRQMRLLASERSVGEHTVVCFYRILIRGDRDYEDFLDNPKDYGDRYFAPLVSDDYLKQWVIDKSERESIPQKSKPNEKESGYLWSVMGQENSGPDKVFICETAEWIKAVTEKQLENRLILICNEILGAADNGSEEKKYLSIPGTNDLYILCRYFYNHRKLLLVKPFYKAEKEEQQDIEEQYSSLLNLPQENIEDKDILKHSARSYPNEVLLDDDFWLEVERDEEANLALSSEESGLLQSVHNFGSNDQSKGFPLFINGRAGSGKSTILLYLFADYLRYYLQDKKNNPRPLYLTCSQDLLDRSREGAEKLIKCSHRSLETQQLSEDEYREEMIESFQVFHRFLLSLVPDSDRRHLFSQEKFINYGRFKSLWKDKFAHDPRAKEQYGPDHSWHVIRSYIKGLSIDDYLDQEEYAEQPKNERTVTQEKFDTIYEKVWKNWYKNLCAPIDNQRQFWDDQDLIRYLLDQNLIKPSYPVIFCDEAQDFTRIELEALLRLSIFSDRDLHPYEVNRVPFAFAGDPFQTLNPTGFRWGAIKAAYVSKFVHALDTNRSAKVGLNYRELSFNYRSTENIVRLCNTIQGLRAALFGITDLKPQATWLYEKFSPMPVWFDRGASGVMENIKKQTELVIIVPCDEGDEKTFVQNDPYLDNVVEKDDTGVPQNVLSPTRAKGLEFNRVVLYGFGENAPDALLGYLDQESSVLAEDQDKALPLEYFVNRLYVAASRPKRRLFIIDSQMGLEKLWKFAKNADVQKKIIERIRDGEEDWKDQFVMLQPGNIASWEEDREDPAVVGDRYERDGIAKRDSYLMRQAALAYQGANNSRKAMECRAHALFFEKEYEKSGEKFIECENVEEALNAFWEGGIFERISALVQQFPTIRDRQEFLVADLLTKEPTLTVCIQLLEEIESTDIPQDESWRHALLRIFDTINQCESENVENWQQVSNLATSLNKKIEIPEKILAEIKYRSHDYEGAIVLWENVNETSNENYRKAKELILVNKMERGITHPWTEEEKHIVAEHYIEKEHYKQAADIFFGINNSYGIGKILEIILQTGQESDTKEFLNMLLITMIKNGEWIEVIRLLEKNSCKQIKDSPKLKSILRKDSEKWNAKFTQKIAISDALAQSEKETQSYVSRFLREKYIRQPVRSWIDIIRPELVGSAIERAGRHMDGLKFYENIEESEECTDGIKRHASLRWVVCKNKQIAYEKSFGSTPRARRLEEDRDNKIQRLGLNGSDQESEFPDVDMIERLIQHKSPEVEPSKRKLPSLKSFPRTTSADRVSWTIENFSFLFSREQNRVNITEEDSMHTASILLSQKECKSTDVEFSKDQGIFSCEDWDIVVDLNHLDTERMLDISFRELGISIRIAV